MAGTRFLCSSAVGGYLRLQSQGPDHTGLLLVLHFKLISDQTDFIVDRVGHSHFSCVEYVNGMRTDTGRLVRQLCFRAGRCLGISSEMERELRWKKQTAELQCEQKAGTGV